MIDKTKKYLIAIDIDDTLRDSKGKISKKNIDVIKKVMAKGHYVTICSGRPKNHSLEVAKQVGALDYLISFNGASVDDLKNNNVIFKSKIAKEELRGLIKLCIERDVKGVLTLDDIDYVTKTPNHEKQKLLNYDEFDKLISNNDFAQCLVIDKNIKKINEIREIILSSNYFNIGNQSCFSKVSDIYWFCINNKNASKGKGLMVLASYLKIPLSNVIAIGNDENDVSMFQIAGISVAMDNASDNVKKYANVITKSNVKDGVAEFLKELL